MSNEADRPKLMKVPEVAEILRISAWQVYQLVERGIIPHVWVGKSLRVDSNQLDTWIAQGGQKEAVKEPVRKGGRKPKRYITDEEVKRVLEKVG